jgi:hypothetical protein
VENNLKRFFLVFYLRGLADQVVFEVNESTSDELMDEIEILCRPDSASRVFAFDAVGGQSAAVNFEFVQSVRFLWEPAFDRDDVKDYDGAIRIWRLGSNDPIVTSSGDSEHLNAFFFNVGMGHEACACPTFLAEDGELFALNASELLYLIVPTSEVNEGLSIVQANDMVEAVKLEPKLKAVKPARKPSSEASD